MALWGARDCEVGDWGESARLGGPLGGREGAGEVEARARVGLKER